VFVDHFAAQHADNLSLFVLDNGACYTAKRLHPPPNLMFVSLPLIALPLILLSGCGVISKIFWRFPSTKDLRRRRDVSLVSSCVTSLLFYGP
jgi:hypothetical protein